MMCRVHLNSAALFAQLQLSITKYSLMLFGTAGSKDLLRVRLNLRI
jgi:hypothetical protein